jgi:amidase
VRADVEQRGAVEGTAELLRGLGHEVVERPLDYDPAAASRVLARYLRGVYDEARAKPHPERLSRRTKGYMRIGRSFPAAFVRRAVAAADADADRINRVFDDGFDVVLTPMFTRRPLRVGEYEGAGALRTLNGSIRWVPWCGVFNHTGQPAAAVPAGFTGDGFPLSVQLVAAPGREDVLVSLSAQLERERDWAAHAPAFAA